MTPAEKVAKQRGKAELRKQMLLKMKQLDNTFPMGSRWEILRDFVKRPLNRQGNRQ